MGKILHINSNYLTSKLHENLVDKLSSSGFQNEIYMPIKDETKDEFLYESKHSLRHPVAFKNRDKFFFKYKQKKIIKNIGNTFDFSDIDIIHAHTLFTDGNVARKIKEKFGKPYVVTVRGMTDINGFFKKRINLRHIGRKILEEADAIIFLSDSNKKELFRTYYKKNNKKLMDKSYIIPNGIDDFWFENEYKPKELKTDSRLKLLYVGKLTKEKNAPKIIEVMRKLQEIYNIETEATFIGKALDENIRETLSKVNDLPIKLIDQINRETLIQHYREHDIFIMPSYTETFGLVYPEAMSQGLPVIYTNDQGFDNQFPDGLVGYSVNPHDAEDIAKKIKLIMENYNETSQKCIESYKKFDWDRISGEYSKVYNDVLIRLN